MVTGYVLPGARRTGALPRKRRKQLGIDRRRHDENAQVVPERRLNFERQRQSEIGIEAAFMEFVEDEKAHLGDLRIGLQPAR